MTEIVRKIIEIGFTRLKVFSIIVKYVTWNIGSKQVLENNGMENLEYIEKEFEKNRVWIPEYKVGISEEKWIKMQQTVSNAL